MMTEGLVLGQPLQDYMIASRMQLLAILRKDSRNNLQAHKVYSRMIPVVWERITVQPDPVPVRRVDHLTGW